MLVKNLTLLLNRKQVAANRMALSDLKTDIWKVGFSAIVVFYSFRRHHHQVETIGGMMLVKNLTSFLYWK